MCKNINSADTYPIAWSSKSVCTAPIYYSVHENGCVLLAVAMPCVLGKHHSRSYQERSQANNPFAN